MAIDLSAFADQLGDPSLYFATEGVRTHPLVYLHATGDPVFAAVDGKLVPYAEYAGVPVAQPTPAPLNLLTSGPAVGAFRVAVAPPLQELPPIRNGGN